LTEEALTKLAARTPADLCRAIGLELEPETVAILSRNPTPSQLLDELMVRGLHVDAVRYLAHALPKRESVCWGYMAIRKLVKAGGSDAERRALSAAGDWLREPSDERARLAGEAGQGSAQGTAAGMLALAVFFAGNNIGPKPEQPVKPPDNVTGALVAGLISVSVSAGDPTGLTKRYSNCLRKGMKLGRGQPRLKA
jgi:hypothetical protein